MKNKFDKISKIFLGMLIFYFIVSIIAYGTYYVTFDNRELSFKNFMGLYFILLQVVILVKVTTNKNDE
jgi:hypothetical protein